MWRKLNAFITVAEQGGFAKAASKLRFSKATITRYIQELESEYGAKFFARTTRHVALTEQGKSFYRHALEMVQLHDKAQHSINKTAERVQGHIKIGLPTSILYHFSREVVPKLLQDYSELTIEMVQGNHIDDLLSGHFDMVLHCGLLPDVGFYYEKIADWHKVLCASPGYLKQFGYPKYFDDLKEHQCLDHVNKSALGWRLIVDGKPKNIKVPAKVKVDSSMMLKELAIKNMGIVYLPSFTVNDALSSGALKPILKNIWPKTLPIYALFPVRKHTNKKLSIVIDVLRDLLD